MGSSKFKRLVERRNISVPWFSTQIILINGPTLLSLTWSHSYFISGIPVTSYITPSIYLDTLYLDTIYLDNIYLRRHAVSPGDVWAELHLAGPHLGVGGEGAVLHVDGVAQPALLLRHLTRAHTAAAGIRASNEPSRRLREVLQSRRRSLLGPLLGWKRLPAPTQWICWPDFL